MIERVVVENFKSYAGRHQIGPFHKNFTAVVGPNGSGKSNLLECLIFAFGKRATKMRLKKLSELIHHSKAHPNFDHASVTVYFQDILDRGYADYEVLPNSQFSLSRIVHKSGHSKYDVNGHESSYEEVTALLKQRGIDLEHNRFLILQGEVEQIALMKPKGTQDDEGKAVSSGLLDYLEEIIGTSNYVPQIAEAEKRMEEAHEGLAQRQNSVNQGKEALSSLEGPKNEALAAIEVEKELFQLRNLSYYLARLKNSQRAVQLEGREKKLAEEKEKVEQLFLRKKEENKEVIELFSRKEKEMRTLTDQEAEFKRDYERLELTHTESSALKERADKRLQDTKEQIQQQEAKLQTLLNSLEDITIALPGKENELGGKVRELEEVKGRYQERALEVMQMTEELQKERNRKLEEMRPVQAQLGDSQVKLQDIQAKIDRLNQEQADNEKNRENLETQLKTIADKKTALIAELEALRTTLNEANHKREEAKATATATKQKYDELAHHLNQLQEKKQRHDRSFQKAQSANKMDAAIKLAVRQGNLAGVRGRLGDLGAVPAAFDVAVSSAFPKLDNYVVGTTEDGQRLIDFVRDHRLGKVTALILDKQRPPAPSSHPIPKGAARLYDTIQLDQPDLAPAFWSVFSDTLVTKTLEEARQVGFGSDVRRKVVSQAGDIVNPSGDMQGFAAPKRGKMRLIGQSSEDIAMEDGNFEGQIAALETERNQLGAEMKRGQEEVTKWMRTAEDCKTKLKAGEEDMREYDERERVVAGELRAIRELPRKEQDMAALTTPLQKQTALVAKITKTVEMMQENIARVEAQIEAAGGAQFHQLKVQKAEKEGEVRGLEEEIQRLRTKLGQAGKDSEKARTHKGELECKLAEIEQESKALTAKVDAMVQQAIEIARQIEQATAQKNTLLQELDMMKTQQSALKEEFGRITEQRNGIKTQMKELKVDMKKNEEQLETWNKEIEENRAKHRATGEEYADLIEKKVEKEEIDLTNEPKRRHKDLDAEEKKDLLFPISTEFTMEDLESLQPKEALLQRLLTLYSEKVAQSKPDLHVLQEYRERYQTFAKYQEELDITRQEVDGLRLTCSDIKLKRYEEFSAGFLIISKKLREMYQMLTRGGDAELEYADSTDPFAEGIVFTVRPPKKSWKKMANLSGGEKTLSSLALVFALHHYKPTALYVMDEVDAALDFQNVSIIANYIKSRTRDAQFIIVSLRYQNFELADRLIGVYKTNDASKTLSISPGVLEDSSSNLIIRQTVENIRRTQLVAPTQG